MIAQPARPALPSVVGSVGIADNKRGCVIQSDASGHPTIQVQVGALPSRAIIDTGATMSVLDSKIAQQLSLQDAGVSATQGLTSSVAFPMKKPPSILLCGRVISLPRVLIADLGGLLGDRATAIGMILGQDALSTGLAKIDFPNKLLDLDAAAIRPSELTPVIRANDGKLLFDIAVNGVQARAAIDTGSAVPLYVAPRFFRSFIEKHLHNQSTAASMGIEGLSTSDLFTVHTVEIGASTLKFVPAQAPTNWVGEEDVVLGAPILERFALYLDLKQREIGLIGSPRDVQAPFARDRSGMNVMRTPSGLKVVYVAPDGPAFKAGLRAGDLITQVDRQQVGSSLFERRPRMGAEPAGTIQAIKLSDGRELQLVLRDYF